MSENPATVHISAGKSGDVMLCGITRATLNEYYVSPWVGETSLVKYIEAATCKVCLDQWRIKEAATCKVCLDQWHIEGCEPVKPRRRRLLSSA